jgi:hypothetical protein
VNRLQLSTAVMAWLHRLAFRSPVADFDAVGTWVTLAEQDMNMRLRARCMITRVSQPVIGQYTPLPCDFLEAYDVRLENGPELKYQPRGMMANARWARILNVPGDPAWSGYSPPSIPWNNGQPNFYSIVGGEMELSPFPDAGNPAPQLPNLQLAYYQRQELGSADTDTTAVLTQYPAIYIYGTLVQSAPFLRDDPRVATWSGLYEAEINGANSEGERARWQGTRLQQRYARLA